MFLKITPENQERQKNSLIIEICTINCNSRPLKHASSLLKYQTLCDFFKAGVYITGYLYR